MPAFDPQEVSVAAQVRDHASIRLLVVSLSTYAAEFNDGKLDELGRQLADVTAVAGDVSTLWGRGHADRKRAVYAVHVLPTRWGRLNATTYLVGLRALAERLRPTIIHVECEPWQMVAFQATRLAQTMRVPVGIQFAENGPNLRGIRGAARLAAGRIALGRCDYAVGWSEGSAAVARRLAPRIRVEAFPATGVPAVAEQKEEASLADVAEWFGTGSTAIAKIAFVGRFSREKGIGEFIQICDSLADRIPLRVAIAGGEEDDETLAPWATARPWAHLHGVIDRPAVGRLLAAADVLVVPSRSTRFVVEQFGKAPVEAMALGTPVFAFDCGALREVIGNGGRVVPEGATDQLVSELAAYFASPSADRRALAAKALHRARAFTDANLANRLIAIWSGLAGKA